MKSKKEKYDYTLHCFKWNIKDIKKAILNPKPITETNIQEILKLLKGD